MNSTLSGLLEKMSPPEQAEIETFAEYLILRRKIKKSQVLDNDIPIQELMRIVQGGGAFNWLNSENEDLYTIDDGEEVQWPKD